MAKPRTVLGLAPYDAPGLHRKISGNSAGAEHATRAAIKSVQGAATRLSAAAGIRRAHALDPEKVAA